MKKGTVRRRGLQILCGGLSLILTFLVGSAVYLETMLGQIQRPPEQVTPPASQGTLPTQSPSAAAPVQGKLHILLIGQDRRGSTGRSLSDAMILCTLDRETGVLTMTSFLRDTYVTIPGHGKNKLNVAYPLGGMELLDRVLYENFGVTVDGNVEVDFSQFERIIDAVGGVEMELTAEEAAHLQHEYGFVLREGKNLLRGQEALGYARIRKLGTDFARTQRQRALLTALVEKFRNVGIWKLHGVLKELLGMVTTDLPNAQILSLALELAPMLRALELRSQHIPAQGTYTFRDIPGVGNCIVADMEANRKILAETLEG